MVSVAVMAALALAALAPVADAAIIFKSRFGPLPPEAGSLTTPYDVAVDSGGDIFVVDQGMHRIQKYDSNGRFIMSIGEPHGADGTVTDDGQLYFPQSIATDSTGSFLYVADTSNSRIQVFSTADGAFIRKWGSPGVGEDELDNPAGIALDAQDNVYVADTRNQRVMKFSATGTFIKQWGENGTTEGKFRVPVGVAVNDLTGRVYVTDELIGRFQEFTLDGGFVAEYGLDESGTGYLLHHPDEITIDPTGGLAYVIESGGNGGGDGQEVSIFDLKKSPNESFVTDFWGTNRPNSTYGFSPHGIHFNPDNGDLFVAAPGFAGYKIFRYNTLGTPKFDVEDNSTPKQVESRGSLGFDFRHNMMVGNCSVKATGSMKTPQKDPIFDGETFQLKGPVAVAASKAVLDYRIPLTKKQLRAVRETEVKIVLTFRSPNGCNNGIEQPEPVDLRYTL